MNNLFFRKSGAANIKADRHRLKAKITFFFFSISSEKYKTRMGKIQVKIDDAELTKMNHRVTKIKNPTEIFFITSKSNKVTQTDQMWLK